MKEGEVLWSLGSFSLHAGGLRMGGIFCHPHVIPADLHRAADLHDNAGQAEPGAGGSAGPA
ncbi:hypothetical protein ACFSQ7_48530 [Paenibacillus rhizoplanae]